MFTHTIFLFLHFFKKSVTKQLFENRKTLDFSRVLLPAAGLEPARGCPQQILSLPRLPFRHAGLINCLQQPNIILTYSAVSDK